MFSSSQTEEDKSMKKAFISFLILTGSLFLAGDQILLAQSKGEVKMEWLSHSHFRFTSPMGKIWLTNPHLDNPDNKTQFEDIKADVIVVADGHRDEIGKAPEIAAKTGAKIVAVRELALGYLAKVAKVPEKLVRLLSFRRAKPGQQIIRQHGGTRHGLPRELSQSLWAKGRRNTAVADLILIVTRPLGGEPFQPDGKRGVIDTLDEGFYIREAYL
jgi:hypothetical protein